MESPLLQYAREENQRQSENKARMGAQAIGYQLAQQELTQRKEIEEKTNKLKTFASMYEGYGKGSGGGLAALRGLGETLGIDVSSMMSYDSELAKDLGEFVGLVQNKKTLPEAINMATANIFKKHGKMPPEIPGKYTISNLTDVEGGKVTGTANEVLDYMATTYGHDQALKAALERNKGDVNKAEREVADEEYKVAKDEWARMFEAYKADVPVNMQMFGDFDAFMQKAKESPTVLQSMLERMKDTNPADVVRYNRIRKIFDRRLGLMDKSAEGSSVDDFYKSLGVE